MHDVVFVYQMASLVLLSMFIGAITISMAERVQERQRMASKKKMMRRQTSARMRNNNIAKKLTIDEKNDQRRACCKSNAHSASQHCVTMLFA